MSRYWGCVDFGVGLRKAEAQPGAARSNAVGYLAMSMTRMNHAVDVSRAKASAGYLVVARTIQQRSDR